MPDGQCNFDGFTSQYKNGYLIGFTEPKDATWGLKLIYTPEEIAAFTPEIAEKRTFTISNYDEWYLIGAQWENEVVNYPQNASEEPKNFGTFMLVAYDEHIQFYGNPPTYEVEQHKREIESNRRRVADAKWGNIPDSCAWYLEKAQKDFFYKFIPEYIEYKYFSIMDKNHPGLKDHTFDVGHRFAGTSLYDGQCFHRYKEILAHDESEITEQYNQFMVFLCSQLDETSMSDEEKLVFVSNPENLEAVNENSISYTGSFNKFINEKYVCKVKIPQKALKEEIPSELTAEDIAYYMARYFVYIDPRTNTVGKTSRITEADSVTKEDIQEWKNSFKGKSYKNLKKHFEEGSYWKDLTLEQIYELCKNKKWFVKLCNSIIL